MEPFIATEMNPGYLATLRKMTVAEKFEKSAQLHRTEVARRVAMVREKYPTFTEAEVDRIARCLMLHEAFASEG